MSRLAEWIRKLCHVEPEHRVSDPVEIMRVRQQVEDLERRMNFYEMKRDNIQHRTGTND